MTVEMVLLSSSFGPFGDEKALPETLNMVSFRQMAKSAGNVEKVNVPRNWNVFYLMLQLSKDCQCTKSIPKCQKYSQAQSHAPKNSNISHFLF